MNTTVSRKASNRFQIDVVAYAPNRRAAEETRARYITRRHRTKAVVNKRVGLAGRPNVENEAFAIVRMSNKNFVYYGATSNLEKYYNNISQQLEGNANQSSFASYVNTYGVENLGRSYNRAVRKFADLSTR